MLYATFIHFSRSYFKKSGSYCILISKLKWHKNTLLLNITENHHENTDNSFHTVSTPSTTGHSAYLHPDILLNYRSSILLPEEITLLVRVRLQDFIADLPLIPFLIPTFKCESGPRQCWCSTHYLVLCRVYRSILKAYKSASGLIGAVLMFDV